MNDTLIIHVASHYPPYVGGLEQVAKEVVEELALRGNNVLVLTSRANKDAAPIERKNNVKVKELWSFEFAHTAIAPTLPFHLLTLPKKSIIHLHLAQAYFPELVFLFAKLRKIPYVVHFHLDVGPSGILGPLFLVYKKLVWRPLLNGAKKVIVFSEAQSRLVESKYHVRKDSIAIIPNGVGSKFFSVKPTPLSPKDQFQILYVGRLSVQKRVERLIEAMSLLDIPARLVIVGDGEERTMLQKLTKKLGLTSVSFEGKKSSEELIAYYRNADVFVLSSDIEGMPLVVLEAMAAGLPIIGSNVLGIRELVRETGVLVDEPYANGFARALAMLWTNPKEREKLSLKSVKKAEQYTWKKLVAQLEDIYRGVCK